MALCDAIACVFLLSIAPPYGMSILHSYHCSGTCNHLRGRSRFTSCLLSKWLYFIVISDGPLYHNKKRQGTTTMKTIPCLRSTLYHNKKRQKSDFQRSKPIRKMASRWCPGAVWSVRIGHKVFPYSFPYALNTGLSAAVQSNTTADDLFPKTNQKRPQRSQKDTLTTLSYNSFFPLIIPCNRSDNQYFNGHYADGG